MSRCLELGNRPCGSYSAYAAGCREEPCRVAARLQKQLYRAGPPRAAGAPPDPSWRADAACRDVDAAVFFPEVTASVDAGWVRWNKRLIRDPWAEARAICASCPVWEPCLEETLRAPAAEDYGYRGRRDPWERQRLRRERKALAV